MSINTATIIQSSLKWSVEGFARFWANPSNPEIIKKVICPDIIGYWPRAKHPLVGAENYYEGIITFLWGVPKFTAKVCDYAINGDTVFIRWEATGKPPVGPEIIQGVDRLLLREGLVLENRVHSDHPVFDFFARTEKLG